MSAAPLPDDVRIEIAADALIEIGMTAHHLLRCGAAGTDESVLRTLFVRIDALASGGYAALSDGLEKPEELRAELFPTYQGAVQ